MVVSCSDQSSLTIADGCVKLGISDVGSGSAGRERGRNTKGVDIELSTANREYMRPNQNRWHTHLFAKVNMLDFFRVTVAVTE